MTTLKSTTLSIAVHRPDKNPVFGEGTTHVSLQDDAAGPFIELRQFDEGLEAGHVKFDLEELIEITKVAKRLIEGWPEGER